MEFTPKYAALLRDIGSRYKAARLGMRLSARAAADATATPSPSGHLDQKTWRAVERGYTQTEHGHVPYRATPLTYVAMGQVVEIDGAAICRELGLEPVEVQQRREDRVESVGELRAELLDLRRRVDAILRRLD
ncbi:MAG: hypothetical protein JWM85_3495 [Acidimicrobiaceae bacterium]|nr:hypothetical protein [Acidimicrobiaceae bacterium]